MKEHEFNEINEARLYIWFHQTRGKGAPVSGLILQEAFYEESKRDNAPKFVASNGQLA